MRVEDTTLLELKDVPCGHGLEFRDQVRVEAVAHCYSSSTLFIRVDPDDRSAGPVVTVEPDHVLVVDPVVGLLIAVPGTALVREVRDLTLVRGPIERNES